METAGRLLGQEASPVLERPVAGDAQAAPLVGGGRVAEEQLRAGVVQRREADLVERDGNRQLRLERGRPHHQSTAWRDGTFV